jgi:hypothetical protein
MCAVLRSVRSFQVLEAEKTISMCLFIFEVKCTREMNVELLRKPTSRELQSVQKGLMQ